MAYTLVSVRNYIVCTLRKNKGFCNLQKVHELLKSNDINMHVAVFNYRTRSCKPPPPL